MQKRPAILRFTAILLILVFSQKSGAGLFLHNLLHTANTATEVPAKQHDNSKGLNYACTCIDDFMMPFDGSEETVYSPPVTNSIVLDTFFEDRIPFIISILSSPRGPPASKA